MTQWKVIRACIAALLLLALCGGLVWAGYEWGSDSVMADNAEAAKRANEAMRRDQARELGARTEVAQRNAALAQDLRSALAEVQGDATKTANADCVRGAGSIGLLNRAVDAANELDSTGCVRDAVPGSTKPDERRGCPGQAMGGGID